MAASCLPRPPRPAGRGKPPGPPPPQNAFRRGQVPPTPSSLGLEQALGAVSCGDEGRVALFDSAAECVLFIDNKNWTSAEQFYKASKLIDDECRERIRLTTFSQDKTECAEDLVTMGQVVQCPQGPAFHHLESMYIATKTKFDQNSEERSRLLASRGNFSPFGMTGDAHCMNMCQHWHTRVLERVRHEFQVSARAYPLAPCEAEEERTFETKLKHEFSCMNFDEDRVRCRLEQIMQEYEVTSKPLDLLGQLLSGDQIDVNVSPLDSVRLLYTQCADAMGMPERNIRILHGGATLQTHKFVYEVGFADGDAFEVVIVKNLLRLSELGKRPPHVQAGNFLAEIRSGVELWPVDN